MIEERIDKMNKKIYIPLLVVTVILIASIFMSQNRKIMVDIEEISKDVIQNVSFDDELNQIDTKTASYLYHIDNAIKQIVYMSNGATAEELAFFQFQNEKACKEGLEKAKSRIEAQKEKFKDYMPKEIQKLENAYIKREGAYLFIAISNHPKEVEKIVNKYMK